MKTLKGFASIVCALCVLTCAQMVYALPASTYADLQNNWQGSKSKSLTNDGTTINYHVDYAVYDTSLVVQNSQAEKNFFESIEAVLDLKRFLYVYQVFNDQSNNNASINYFAVFGKPEGPLNISNQNIGAKNDGAGGIEPSGSGIDNGGTRVVWNFTEGLLIEGKHSWYLILTSESGPVKGDFEARTSQSDFPVIPEPATFALLSSGALIIAGRRKRK